MTTLFLDGRSVDAVLTHDLALAAMRRAFELEAQGTAGPVGRIDLPHSGGWMRVLPAVFEGLGVFGHKVISFHGEAGVRYVVTVFDVATGDMRAVVDAEAITAARTGATAALGADLLCAPEIGPAAMIGTGSVARSQLGALQAVRPATEIRVYSRNPANRAGFIAEMQPSLDVPLIDCVDVEEAIAGAGLVTLATKSPTPMLGARHLTPGVHVNSVGSARPNLSELEPDAFAAFDIVVCDSVDLVFGESGDGIEAVSSGAFDPSSALDLAAVVVDPPARREGDMTLFKSTGNGLQDLALAVAVMEAVEAGHAPPAGSLDDLLTVKRFGATGRT